MTEEYRLREEPPPPPADPAWLVSNLSTCFEDGEQTACPDPAE